MGEEPSSLHNSKHTKHTHATRVQKTTLYSDSTTTHSKQHRRKGVQLNGFPCANNHCRTRYEQSFCHNKHTHTFQKVSTDQHSRHNHKVHRKLHQGTQSLHIIHKLHIHTSNNTSIKRQFKAGVSQGGILSPTLFNTYTADLPPHRTQVHVMSYANDIIVTSTHKHECNKEMHITISTYSF